MMSGWLGGLKSFLGVDTPNYVQGFGYYFANPSTTNNEEWYLSLNSFFIAYDKVQDKGNFDQDIDGFVSTFLQWLPHSTDQPLVILRIFLKLKQYCRYKTIKEKTIIHLVDETSKRIQWQEPSRWFVPQLSHLRRNEALTNDLRELIQEHFRYFQDRNTSLTERGAFLDGNFHLMLSTLLVQIEITNPLPGKTLTTVLLDWKKHLETLTLAKSFLSNALIEWSSMIARLADSTPQLVFGVIAMLLKLREKINFSPSLLRSLLKDFYLFPLSPEELSRISQQLSVVYGLGAWANDGAVYREWFKLLCDSLTKKGTIPEDEAIYYKASCLLVVLVKSMMTGPGIPQELLADKFLHRAAIYVLSSYREGDPTITYEHFLKIPKVVFHHQSVERFLTTYLAKEAKSPSLDRLSNMITHVFSEGETQRLAPLALKCFELIFVSLFSQATTRSYSWGASSLTELSRKRQVDFLILTLQTQAFSNLFTLQDYEVIAPRMKDFQSFYSAIDGRFEAAEKRVTHPLPSLYLLMCRALADHATSTRPLYASLELLRSCKDLQCAPVYALVSRILKKYLTPADLESLSLFNEATELTVSFLTCCRNLISTETDCHAPLRAQLFDDISPLTIYAGSIYEKICQRTITLNEVTTFSSKNKIFKAMLAFLPEIEAQNVDIDSFKRDFDSKKKELENLNLVRKWLKSINVNIVVGFNLEENQPTLLDIEQWIEHFRNTFALEDKYLRHIALFLDRNSSLFRAKSRQYLQSKNKQSLTAEDLKGMIDATYTFLNDLVAQKLLLRDCAEVSELVRSMGTNLSEELNTLAEVMTDKKITAADVDNLHRTLESTLELLYFIKQLSEIEHYFGELLPFVTSAEVKHQIVSILRKYQSPEFGPKVPEDMIAVGNTIPLTRAAPALQELEGMFGGLKSWQLQIFHVVHEAHDVIEFFREQHYEFDERSRMVTQEVQGYRFGSELVNYTIAVKDVIVQFLNLDRIATGTQWQVTLATFCKNIGQLLPLERKELDFKLKMIENVQLNIQEIRTYFSLRSSSGISIPFILQLMEHGVYQSQLQLHPSGQELWLSNRTRAGSSQRLPLAILESMIQAMTVYVRDAAVEVIHFIEICKLAQEIHNLRLELEQEGHPCYQGDSSPLNDQGMSRAKFQKNKDELQVELADWKNRVQAVRNEHPRLQMLDRRQLSQLIRGFFVLLHKESSAEAIQHDLAPFIGYCFSEYDAAKLISLETLETHFENVVNGKAGDPLTALNLVGAFVSVIGEQLEQENEYNEDLEAYRDRPHAPELVVLSTGTQETSSEESVDIEFQLYKLAILLNQNQIPHSSQIFWCSDSASDRDLSYFLDRCEKVNDRHYMILGVDFLGASVREALLERLATIYISGNQSSLGPLHLVFSRNIGTEAFSFVQQETQVATEEALPDLRPLLQRRGVDRLHIYRGAESSGKTYRIRSSMKQLPADKVHRLYFNAVEDFTPISFFSSLCQQLRGSKTSEAFESQFFSGTSQVKGICVHFNISPFTTFRRLATFLYDLLLFGVIWDRDSGTMRQIPSDTHWYFFFEIHRAAEGDLSYSAAISDSNVLKLLPVLCHASQLPGTLITVAEGEEFDLNDPDLKLCLQVYRLHKTMPQIGTIQHPALIADTLLGEDEYRVLAAELFRHPAVAEVFQRRSSLFRRKLFIRLLAQRCKWYSVYCDYYTKEFYQIHGNNEVAAVEYRRTLQRLPISQIFILLLKEITALCKEGAQTRVDISRAEAGEEIPYYFACSSIEPPEFSCLHFTPLILEDHTPEEVRNRTLSFWDALHSPHRLRRDLAPALDLLDTSRMQRIVAQQRYVLTPDFALKLLVLHGRAKANMNVILCGHTGVGKSELLRLYSVVINSASQLVPDLIFEMTLILEEMLCRPGTTNALHPRFEEFLRKLSEIKKTNVMMEGSGILETAIAEMEAIVRVAGELKREPQDLELDEENQTFFLYCRNFLVDRIRLLLRQYPLIERTNLLTRVAAQPLVGEPVIEELDELIRLVTEVLSAKFSDLFHPILMHQKITPEDFREHVRTIKRKFSSLKERSAVASHNRDDIAQLRIVAFVDEANATTIMGMLQEVLCDNSLDGEPLPTNIMWVAAINRPQLKNISQANGKQLEEEEIEDAYSDYTGLRPTGPSKLTYAVRPLAPSLEHLVIDFDELSENQEETFLHLLLQYRTRFHNDQEREDLLRFVMLGQKFIREASILNVRVSIRDIMRAVELYHFFRFTRPGQLLMKPERLQNELKEKYQGLQSSTFTGKIDAALDHWEALLMSIAMAYYFRLTESGAVGSRAAFDKMLLSEFNSHKGGVPDRIKSKAFGDYVRSIIRRIADVGCVIFPPGVAKTDALLENLFCIFACVCNKIPLIIVGPPGCSKTLSFTIAVENMKGKKLRGTEETFHSTFFREFPQLEPFRYQCSEQSTDNEIQDTYLSAIERQKLLEGDEPEKCTVRTVVLLDEAGLPKEETNALKAIHFHLDHPRVTTVILSNKNLDAAKTNRALHVLRRKNPSDEDLIALAVGTLFGGLNGIDSISATNRAIVRGLCEAFKKANLFTHQPKPGLPVKKNMFHLRDFVYLLRFLHKRCCATRFDGRADATFELNGAVLCEGIARNFGGLDPENFQGLVSNFVEEVNKCLHTAGCDNWLELPFDWQIDRTVERLSDCLGERLIEGENPNTASFRYMMLLDPTDTEAAISLLFSLAIVDREKTRLCTVGDFPQDGSQLAASHVVSQVRTAMELGETVILLNSAPIHSCFYDVFNRHFTLMGDGQEHYANLAVGKFSRHCKVHKDFKIIVHIPMSQLHSTQSPLLNRFERYILSSHLVLKELAQKWMTTVAVEDDRGDTKQVTPFEIVYQGCSDMIERLHVRQQQNELLYGIAPRDTVCSLVLSALELSLKAGRSNPKFPTTFHVSLTNAMEKSSEKEEEDEEESVASLLFAGQQDSRKDGGNGNETGESPLVTQLKHLVRQANLHLLQLARPESIFLCRHLPQAYVQEYLYHQEHFSILRFLQHLLLASVSTTEDESPSKKWCIFTRTSGELVRLNHDPLLQHAIANRLMTGDFQDKQKKHRPEWLQTILLSAVPSSEECERRIIEFSNNPDKLLLLASVDMSECTAGQINTLRNAVDRHVHQHSSTKEGEEAPKKIVVLIIHYPLEMSHQSRPCYQAVFLNEWDFVYIDALGVNVTDSTFEEENQVPSESGASSSSPTGLILAGPDRIFIDADVRTWIAKAFGLPTAISKESVKEAFKSFFFQLLRGITQRLDVPFLRPSVLNQLPLSKLFYSNQPRDKVRAERQQLLQKILTNHPYLYRETLSKFADAWSSSLLFTVFKNASEGKLQGRIVASFYHVVRSSLQNLLVPMVIQLVERLSSNLSLESLLGLPVSEDNTFNTAQQLARAVMRTIEPPNVLDLAQQSAASVADLKPIRVEVKHEAPSRSPLYDAVAEIMEKMAATAFQEQHQRETHTRQTYFESLSRQLKKNRQLMNVATLLAENPELQQAVKFDFLSRTLKLGELLNKQTESICIALLDNLVSQTLPPDSAKEDFLAAMWAIQRFGADKFTCLYPLKVILHLSDDAEEEAKMIDFAGRAERGENDLVQAAVLSLLWRQITAIINSDGKDMELLVSRLKKWGAGFRGLNSRLYSRNRAVGNLHFRKEERRRHDVMYTLYLFLLHTEIYSRTVLETFNKEENRPVLLPWFTDQEEEGLDVNAASDFKTALQFATLLLQQTGLWGQANQDAETGTKIRHLLTDLGQAFLWRDENTSQEMTLLWKANVDTFLDLVSPKQHRSAEDSVTSTIWNTFVPLSWSSQTLFVILRGMSDEEQRQVLLAIERPVCVHLKLENTAGYSFHPVMVHISNAQSSQLPPIPQHLKVNYERQPPARAHRLNIEEIVYHALVADVKKWNLPLHRLCSMYEDILKREADNRTIFGQVRLSAIITCTVEKTASDLGVDAGKGSEAIHKAISSWPDAPVSVISTLKKIISLEEAVGTPVDVVRQRQIFLLQRVEPLLRDKLSLNRLGMSEWETDSSSPDMSRRLSFVFDRNSDLGKHYAKMNELITRMDVNAFVGHLRLVEQGITPEISNHTSFTPRNSTSLRGVYRMMIALVCYYEYFNKSQACEFIRNQLTDGSPLRTILDINQVETKAFAFLSSGPLPIPAGMQVADFNLRDPLSFLFSAKAREADSEVDLTMCWLLVNLLAVELGLPRDSNHLEVRIFNPVAMNGTKGPGSTHSRDNMDCGYKMENTLDACADIMGNHKRHRLSLNTTVWGALCWAVLLEPDNVDVCSNHKRLHHFLNYIEDENKLLKKQRTIAEKVRFSIYSRASTFFGYLQTDEEMVAQQMSALFLMNEQLIHLWKAIDNNGNPEGRKPAWKAIFRTVDEVKQYEQELKQTSLDPVLLNYAQLKLAVHENSQGLPKLLAQLQASHADQLVSTLASMNLFFEYCSSRKMDNESPILSKFLQTDGRLKIIRHIPQLLHFYLLLNRHFAYRLSLADAYRPISECFDILAEYETVETMRSLQTTFQAFQQTWSVIRDFVTPQACADVRENRAFELQIPVVDQNTLFNTFISMPNKDEGDYLLAAIKVLVQEHMKFLQATDNEGDELSLLSAPSSSLLKVIQLPTDFESAKPLLAGAHCAQSELEDMILSQVLMNKNRERSSLSFDLKWIEKKCKRMLSDLPELDLGELKSGGLKFHWKVTAPKVDLENETKSSSTSSVNAAANSRLQQLDGVIFENDCEKLFVLAHQLPAAYRLNISSPMLSDNPQTSGQHKDFAVKIENAAKCLLQCVRWACIHPNPEELDDGEEGTPIKTIGDLARRLQIHGMGSNVALVTTPFNVLAIVSISQLQQASLWLARKNFQQEFLYANVGAFLTVPLSSEAKGHLQILSEHVLAKTNTQDQARSWFELISSLLTMFSGAKTQNVIKAACGSQLPLSMIVEVQVRDISNSSSSQLSILKLQDNLSSLIPSSVLVKNYAPYMRILHRLAGELGTRLKLTDVLRQQKGQSNKVKEVYQELVPKAVESQQPELQDSTFVAQPTPFQLEKPSIAPIHDISSSVNFNNMPLTTTQVINKNFSAYWRPQPHKRAALREALETALRVNESARGLPNSANACWLNSLIQSLVHLPPFFSCVLDTSQEESVAEEEEVQLSPSAVVIVELVTDVWTPQTYPNSGRLLQLLAANDASSKFIRLGEEQMDAHEMLFKAILPQLTVADRYLPSQLHPQRVPTPLFEVFGIQKVTQLTCQHCNTTSTMKGDIAVQSIPVYLDRKQNRLETMLSLDGFIEERQCESPQCGKKGCSMRERINNLPEVLCFHIVRFANQQTLYGMEIQKREDEVEFPLNGFNLRPYLSEELSSSPSLSDEECQYDLFSVCIHSGSLRLGHYFSYARKRSRREEKSESGSASVTEQWYLYDDSYTQAVERSRLSQSETKRGVYMLFYVKRKKDDFSFSLPMEVEEEKSVPPPSSPSTASISASPLPTIPALTPSSLPTFAPSSSPSQIHSPFIASPSPTSLPPPSSPSPVPIHHIYSHSAMLPSTPTPSSPSITTSTSSAPSSPSITASPSSSSTMMSQSTILSNSTTGWPALLRYVKGLLTSGKIQRPLYMNIIKAAAKKDDFLLSTYESLVDPEAEQDLFVVDMETIFGQTE